MLLCHISAVSAVSVIAITSDDVYQDSPAGPLLHRKPFARPHPHRMTFARYSWIDQLTVAARRIAISALAAFSSQAMEIKFYNVPTGMIQFGDSLYCRLESTNRYHSYCIALCILALHDAWSSSGISGVSPGSSFDMWICSITVSCSAT